MTEITRVILWNVPPALSLAMYLAAATSGVILLLGIWRHVRVWRRGRSDNRLDDLVTRISDLIIYALGQKRLLSNRFRGVMHLLIFSGFLILLIATLLTALQHDVGVDYLRGVTYLAFSFMADLFGVVLILGVGFAFYNRYVRKPAGTATNAEDIFALVILVAVAFTGFLLEGARLVNASPSWEVWSFVGYGTGKAFAALGLPVDEWQGIHRGLWALHVAVVAAFFVSLPLTKFFHVITSPVNIFLRSHRTTGTLRPEPPIDGSRPMGASAPGDFTWKQLFDLSACTKCGRCQEVCPAWNSGKPLSPKNLILELKDSALSWNGKGGDFHAAVSPDELWSCTTCGACAHECPVFVEHIDKIVDLRRRLVDRGQVSEPTAKALESILCFGNPSQCPQSDRAGWASSTRINTTGRQDSYDYLYWVGCAGAYDTQGQPISVAVSKILHAAGINFTILGDREKCCGEPARRLGEEGLFQKLARDNIASLNSISARKILTHCPHCYNVLKNEYPQLGGDFEVVHHSEVISDLIESGKIVPKRAWDQKLTFHDPCYLGRHNGIYEAPRRVLQAIPSAQLVELEQSRERSFCCGGGGGQMWIEMNAGKRINYLRFEQAEGLGPDVVATGCPYCKTMLDVAATYRGMSNTVKVRDIAEIVCDSL